MTAATDHVVLAYYSGEAAATALVVPCVFRCGVWAVARSANRPPRWQLVHAPSGSAVRLNCGTKREAVRACKRLGNAAGMWEFDCGFGAAPALPTKLERLSGRAPFVGIG